jgi:hypothetical protein
MPKQQCFPNGCICLDPKPKTIGIQELWGNKSGQPQDLAIAGSEFIEQCSRKPINSKSSICILDFWKICFVYHLLLHFCLSSI